jgi:glycosyltransferase involved in cell wall biosynthesis
MNRIPLVSIIVPAYNAAPWILETLASVQRQNLGLEWELIVVNDGSTDDTAAVVSEWASQQDNAGYKFIFLNFDTNKGVSVCRNQGLDVAQGTWVVFLDADDILADGALCAILKDSIITDDLELVFSPTELTSVPKQILFEGPKFEDRVFQGMELYSFYRPHPLLGNTVDVCLSILFNRTFLNEYSLRFTEGMSFLEDGEFIARAFSVAKNTRLQWNSFYQLRVHPDSTSKQSKIYDYAALEGHFNGIASLISFNLRVFGAANDAFLQGLVIKYSLLPYQSAIGPRGIDWKKHRWVHKNMCDRGFYPIDTNSGNAYLVMLAKWLNRSVYYYYLRWWFRLLGLSLRARFIKK